jgi:hypothetical protein
MIHQNAVIGSGILRSATPDVNFLPGRPRWFHHCPVAQKKAIRAPESAPDLLRLQQ